MKDTGGKKNKEEKELKCKEIGDLSACIQHHQKISACINILLTLLKIS